MERRTFLRTGAAGALTLAIPKWLLGQTCDPTQADRYGYGPYYLENAPQRTRIASLSEPGQQLSISGVVSNCSGPLPGVRLEVWQATHTGCYIHPSQASCPDGGNPAVSRLWGQIVSGAQGRYAFDSIKPGKYLNGSRYRPSHIHFRIRTPAGASVSTDLVTQLYFEGDEHIPGDYAADHPSARTRIIPLTGGSGPLDGVFNVRLPGNSTGIGSDPLSDPALNAYDLFIRRDGTRILFHLPALPGGEPVEMRLLDAQGRRIQGSRHRQSPVELDARRLPRGGGLVEFIWNAGGGVRKESAWIRP